MKMSQDSDGMWVRRELWSQLYQLRHGTSHKRKRPTAVHGEARSSGVSSVYSEEFMQQVEMLSEVMSGDLTQALNWPAVWVPRTCRSHRYNASTFLQYTRSCCTSSMLVIHVYTLPCHVLYVW
jgi:hypothetical protein